MTQGMSGAVIAIAVLVLASISRAQLTAKATTRRAG